MSLIRKVLFAGIVLFAPYCLSAQSRSLVENAEVSSFQEYNNKFSSTLNELRKEYGTDKEEMRIWSEYTLYSDGSIGNIRIMNNKQEGDRAYVNEILSKVPKCDLVFIGDSLRVAFPFDPKIRKGYFEEMKYSIPRLSVISDERPEYTGGMDEFVRYLQSNIDQSLLSGLEKNKQNVVLSFYVNKKGQVKDVDLRAKNLSIPLKKELIRVVKNMPLWDIEGKTLKKDVAFSAYISLSKDGSFNSEILKSRYRATDGDKPAVFPGGMERLGEFLREEIRYPQEALAKKLQGRVQCRLQIDNTGKITNIEVAKGLSPELDREAMRVARSLPDFEPAVFEGSKVKSILVISVTFRIPVVKTTEVRTITYR